MNALKLIIRSAAYYWRTHLGVAAGAAVATAVLVGALVVGDSVRYTLGTLAVRRLGDTSVAMSSGLQTRKPVQKSTSSASSRESSGR